jgi:hypothetical protein
MMHIHFNTALETLEGVYRQNFVRAASSLHKMDEQDVVAGLEQFCRLFRVSSAKFALEEEPAAELEPVGLELIRKRQFQLPFDRCYFEWPNDVGDIKIAGLFACMDDDRLNVWSAGLHAEGFWGASQPWMVRLDALGDHLQGGGSLGDYPGIKGWGERAECKITCIREVASCVALLASRGLQMELVEPREAVNKKRRLQGKPELPSYTIVRARRLN